MNNKIKIFFICYFFIVLLVGIVSLLSNIFKHIRSEDTFSISTLNFVILMCIPIIILILSIISLVLKYRNNLPNIFLVYPIYFMCYLLIWIIIIPILIGVFYPSTINLGVLDKFYNFNPVFYVFDIVFSSFMLYRLIKHKK